MKKKLLLLLCLGILAVVCIPKVFNKKENASFFAPITIAKFSASYLPCLNVEIENQRFLLTLDLGFSGDAQLSSELMHHLHKKSFIKTSISQGIRGIQHEEKKYQIPKLKIGPIKYHPVMLGEEGESARQEGQIVPTKNGPIEPTGKLGWKLFGLSTLYLDLGNSTLILCDSIETFKKRGHSLETFTKVPLLLDRDFVEFKAQTPKGLLRCLLDTGSTSNLLHRDHPSDEPLERFILDKENVENFSSFQIGEKDFGAIIFHPFPIKLNTPIEAILGMEFLFKHRVFIDFKNGDIYFSSFEE